MGFQMAFRSIGFHTDLILNRLRNEQQIPEHGRTDAERRAEQDRKEQTERSRLEYLRRRIADLEAFERRSRGDG